jgi:hypothetical protein
LPGVDASRLAAIGNSGGGNLTTFLAALCPDLAVLSSSGRPSPFDYTARKERVLCHCSLIPRSIGVIECWHVLGCFAPRPMFIFQGRCDPLFPFDLFNNVARKTRTVYERLGAGESFRAEVVPGEHSWDAHRRELLGDFLADALGLPVKKLSPDGDEADLLTEDDGCLSEWPAHAVDADRLAQELTGRRVEQGLRLCDVFPPWPRPDSGSGDMDLEKTLEILARFEASLCSVEGGHAVVEGEET